LAADAFFFLAPFADFLEAFFALGMSTSIPKNGLMAT
jgi:hypothetical protein